MNETLAPATPLPSASATFTAGRTATAVPNLANCPLPRLPGAIPTEIGGPASAVALISVAPVLPSAVALTRWSPAVLLPKVQEVEARPAASALTVGVPTVPPPAVTAKVTGRPAITLPSRSSTRTWITLANGASTRPLWSLPAITTGATGVCSTVADNVALIPPTIAVMRVVPFVSPVTRPDGETVATLGTLELQLSPAVDIVVPRWSNTVAATCCVAPIASRLTRPTANWIAVARGGSVELVHDPNATAPKRANAVAKEVRSNGRRRRIWIQGSQEWSGTWSR